MVWVGPTANIDPLGVPPAAFQLDIGFFVGGSLDLTKAAQSFLVRFFLVASVIELGGVSGAGDCGGSGSSPSELDSSYNRLW